MSEQISRGRRVDNDEWVEGFYISDLAGKAYICQKVTAMYTFDGARCYGPYIEVDPDTLGRETGLTDLNGKRIFEGDIVHCVAEMDEANMVVIFEDGEFRMVLCERYKTYIPGGGYYAVGCFDKEVIGNIYDDKELLERGWE